MPPARSRFLALLRGINVGGRNLIPKDDLRRCFEDLGYINVRTYIQSGNVLFRSSGSVKSLTAEIEAGLSTAFSYEARVVVLSRREYLAALLAAPSDWGKDDEYKHNALFTLRGITPARVLAELPPPKIDIEAVGQGKRVIFWSASKRHLTSTTMLKLAALPVYRQLTVRNHNTVFKLRELFETV